MARPYITGVGPSSSEYATPKQEALIERLLAEGRRPTTEVGRYNLKIREGMGRSWKRDASALISDLLATSCGTTGCEAHDAECARNWGADDLQR